jgi:hypothetical protein
MCNTWLSIKPFGGNAEGLLVMYHHHAGVGDLAKSTCIIEGCAATAAAKKLCWKHYQRQRRHGDPSAAKRRYELSHECRYCGTQNPADFYTTYKSVCKVCRKVRLINRG